MRDEIAEQLELLRRQPDLPAARRHLPRVEVDLGRSERQASPVGPCVDGARRSAARMRASSSGVLNGLVT